MTFMQKKFCKPKQQQLLSAANEQQLNRQHGYKHAGGVEEAPRTQTQHKRLAHQAAAGSISASCLAVMVSAMLLPRRPRWAN